MEPVKTDITFDEFLKIDLRAGSIVSIEPVPKSTKLLKLEVNFGELGVRTILATVASAYPDRVVVGQKVVGVVNIPPRPMMGFTSHGMLLATKDADGKVVLISPDQVADGLDVG